MVHSEAESRISGDSRCSGKIRSASSASLRAQLCDNVRRPHENIPTSPCVPLYPPQNRLLSRVTSYVSRRPLPRLHLAWLDTPAASATGYIKKFAPPSAAVSVSALSYFSVEKPFPMKRYLSAFVVIFLLPLTALADEGMWLYNQPPKDKIKAKYGFELTQKWLDHLRLASVRFNNGGSGSFVSADGLTFTNHHVGAGCVQQLSTAGHDYIKTGFYAKTRAEEAKCPNLELNQLVGIEDVTDKVNAGVKPRMSAADAGQAQRAAMSQVEKDCSSSTGLRCDVVVLYSGQVYNLYKYKKYTDV